MVAKCKYKSKSEADTYLKNMQMEGRRWPTGSWRQDNNLQWRRLVQNEQKLYKYLLSYHDIMQKREPKVTFYSKMRLVLCKYKANH